MIRTIAVIALTLASANLLAEPYSKARTTASQTRSATADGEKPPARTPTSTFYFSVEGGVAEVDTDFDSSFFSRLSIGKTLNKHFAVELSMLNMEKFSAIKKRKLELGADLGVIINTADVSVTGLDLSLIGVLPMTERLGLYGRLGAFNWDADFDITSLPSGDKVPFPDDDGTNLSLGAGLHFQATPSFALRAGYGMTEVADENLSTASAGFAIYF